MASWSIGLLVRLRRPSVTRSAWSRGGRLKDCDHADRAPAACFLTGTDALERSTARVARQRHCVEPNALPDGRSGTMACPARPGERCVPRAGGVGWDSPHLQSRGRRSRGARQLGGAHGGGRDSDTATVSATGADAVSDVSMSMRERGIRRARCGVRGLRLQWRSPFARWKPYLRVLSTVGVSGLDRGAICCIVRRRIPHEESIVDSEQCYGWLPRATAMGKPCGYRAS